MGAYITNDDVKIRLTGRVKFTDDDENQNALSTRLLNRLIAEAEGQVEFDLSPRFMAPFQGDNGEAFSKLPERPTRNWLRTMCELMACVRVMETDFGRGTVVESDKYAQSLKDRYENMKEQLLAKKKEGQGWMYPPLPSLRLNYMNTEADDGYMGMVLVTGESDGDYPATRINDPAESFLSFKPNG